MMIQDIYIHGGKAYTDSQFTIEAAKAGLRLSYGDECVITLHFDLGVLAEGDIVMAAFDADMLFGEKGTSPMGKAQKEVTAEDAQAQAITLSLPTNTERFYEVVNGSRVAVPVYFGIYLFAAGSEEGYPQVSAALFPVQALPVVATLADTIVPLQPQDVYPTREEVAAEYLPKAEKGTAGGVASLDSTGKVPLAQLPAGFTQVQADWDESDSSEPSYIQNKPSLDYIPTSQKGAANGVAELGSTGKVPSAQLPVATMDTLGAMKVGNAQGTEGIQLNSSNRLALMIPTESQINERSSSNRQRAITTKTLDYAVRSVLPNVTTIPAATTAYSLLDASATSNNHSFTYTHVPAEASVYTLPAVTDTAVIHTITLSVLFRGWYRSSDDDSGSAFAWKAKDGSLLYTDTATPTAGTTLAYSDTALTTSVGTIALYDSAKSGIAMVGSVEFEDSGENVLAPLDGPSPSVGAEICYLCEWSALQGVWTIMPIGMGGEA